MSPENGIPSPIQCGRQISITPKCDDGRDPGCNATKVCMMDHCVCQVFICFDGGERTKPGDRGLRQKLDEPGNKQAEEGYPDKPPEDEDMIKPPGEGDMNEPPKEGDLNKPPEEGESIEKPDPTDPGKEHNGELSSPMPETSLPSLAE